MQQQDPKRNADSGNDSTNEMLQKEKLIDPGNEHTHQNQADDKLQGNNKQNKHEADAGGDGTGTAGPEPGEGKNEEPIQVVKMDRIAE